MNAPRILSVSGAWGAALTILILAMSVLLRLGTELQGGEAVSTLPSGVELGARIAHRIAAMGVGVLAAFALVATWRGEAPPRPSARAVAAVIALTALLSVVGRYSPGYRVDLVTVLNVAGGVALAAAFWTLRPKGERARADPVALAALVLVVALAALGAATDAHAMRGARAFGPLHLWAEGLFAGLALSAAWRHRRRRAVAAATAVLTLGQLALGFALIASREMRPLVLGWTHAMVACALALLLVSLAFGRSGKHLA